MESASIGLKFPEGDILVIHMCIVLFANRKKADIAPLLDVEDMVKMKKPDWKCVFTYIQSFYRKMREHENNQHQYMQQQSQ